MHRKHSCNQQARRSAKHSEVEAPQNNHCCSAEVKTAQQNRPKINENRKKKTPVRYTRHLATQAVPQYRPLDTPPNLTSLLPPARLPSSPSRLPAPTPVPPSLAPLPPLPRPRPRSSPSMTHTRRAVSYRNLFSTPRYARVALPRIRRTAEARRLVTPSPAVVVLLLGMQPPPLPSPPRGPSPPLSLLVLPSPSKPKLTLLAPRPPPPTAAEEVETADDARGRGDGRGKPLSPLPA